jgi:hypothetical protein
MRFILSAGLILLTMCASAQLVNIESRRMHTDSLRHAGNAILSAAYQDNSNVRVFSLKSAFAIQLKSKNYNHMYMLLGNSDWTTVNSNDVVNSAFTHLRYNYKLTEILRWEIFTQWQYNKILALNRRSLTGTGPRVKFISKPHVHAYLGSLYMYEYEVVTGEVPEVNRDHRSSSYLTFTITFPKTLAELVSTAYFQALLSSIDDHRLTWQTALTFQITKRFRWTSSFNYLYDSHAPVGIAARAISFDQGFRVDF